MKTSLSLKSVLFSNKYVIRSVKENALMADKFVKKTYSFPRIWEFFIRCETSVRYSHSLLLQPLSLFGDYLEHCLPLSSPKSTVFIPLNCCFFYVPGSEWSYAGLYVSLAVCLCLLAFFFSLTHFMFIAFDIKKCSAYQQK